MKRINFFLLIILMSILGPLHSMLDKQTFFFVVITSYNNASWYHKNLDMLLAQEQSYTHWKALYIDDCSSDGTADLVEDYIVEHKCSDKIQLQRNTSRQGALANLYYAITVCPDDVVIITYDGDDWFKDATVFSYLNQVYQDSAVWMTYGQYEEYPSGNRGICTSLSPWVTELCAYRDVAWVTSHLRTFYAGLFKRIKREDLLYNGEFFPMTWDLAIMFPMLEMAGKHVKFIEKIVYVYNMDNPLNDFKKDLIFMYELNKYLRGKKRYQPIAELKKSV